ncbi:MAG: bifunctional DNA primase/polymerase [Burkholderiales bacterium]|nr:bifunctional DNA primase/polymerase [Burkholderiales bacterium]
MNSLSVVAGRTPVRTGSVLVLLDAALLYAARGWSVLPCEARDKTPLTMGGVKGAKTDLATIRKWWRGSPNANIGVATGSASRLLVVDVDPRNGGNESLAALEARYGALPSDYVVETGGGGQHIYLRLPEGRSVRCRKLAPGIDIKGDGGYVIAPPSIHPSGNPYRIERGGEVPPAPDWLLDLIGKKGKAQAHAPEQPPVNVDNLRVSARMKCLIREGKPKGQRSEAVFGVIRAMLKAGHSDEEIIGVFMDPANALGEKPQENGRAWLQGEIRRARERLDRDADSSAQGHRADASDPNHSDGPRSAPGGGSGAGGGDGKGGRDDKRTNGSASRNGGASANPLANIVTAAELVQREFPEPRWIVPNVLPEGLTLLAGKSKTGKSWWALQTAVDVAGRDGDVLYLALEDTQRRLQDRILQVCEGESVSARLELTGQGCWPRLDAGGLGYIREWLQVHRNEARLVIVDTLAKVKPRAKRNGNAYDEDYAALEGLKALADEFGVAILIVHHLRKMPDEQDPFNEISGTTGLTGCADTIMVLKRGRKSNDAELCVTGRDVEEQRLPMTWDGDRCRWTLTIAKQQQDESSETGKAIIELLRSRGPMTMREIFDAAGKPQGTIKSRLSRMVRGGRLVLRDAKYHITETSETT